MGYPFKVRCVADEICAKCAQQFGGECRAYILPHSAIERDARAKGMPECMSREEAEKKGAVIPRAYFRREGVI